MRCMHSVPDLSGSLIRFSVSLTANYTALDYQKTISTR